MDVKSVFFNGDRNEEIYIQQPPHFVTTKNYNLV
jgi:hypothetical protein